MFHFKEYSYKFAKGFLIGIGTVIPGLSGGTVAIITGVFESIIESTSNIFKNFKKSISNLFPIGMGALLGLYIFSPIINGFTIAFPAVSKWIFCAISLLAAIKFAKSRIETEYKIYKVIFLFLGIILCLFINFLTSKYSLDFLSGNPIGLFIIGLPLAMALILPAISFSYMLLYFGLYSDFLSAIHNFDIVFLFPLSIGIVFGSISTAKLFDRIIKKFPQKIYCFIFGFVICSVINILVK